MKRGAIGLEQIVFAILALLVVVGAVKITIDLTGKPVQYLLGFGNISAFDQEIIERYEQTKDMNADAISSVNALLYSINRLAVFDDDSSGTKKINSFRKKFGDIVVAEPTIFNDRIKKFTGSKEKVKLDLAEAIVECYAIFKDEAKEDTSCFRANFDNIDSEVIIDKEDIFDGLKKYKDICGDVCKNDIDELIGIVDNIDFQNGLIIKKEKKNVRICGRNHFFIDKIHITTNLFECMTDIEDPAIVGFFVENFALPQELSKSTNPFVYTVEEWLNAYGDPQYILFYEKFPKYEEEYWKASEYNIAFLTILGTEAAFLGLDAVTFGLGKAFRVVAPVIKNKIVTTRLGRLIMTMKDAISKLAKDTGKAVGRMLKKIFVNQWSKKAVRFMIGKQVTKEGLEEIAEKEMKTIFKKNFLKKVGADLSDDSVYLLKKKYIEAFRELGDEVFDPNGKLTQKGIQELNDNFIRVMGGTWQDSAEDRLIMNAIKSRLGGDFDKIMGDVGETLSKKAASMSYRTLTRATIRSYEFAYRTANRARNILKMALRGDMTDEAREKAILKLIENGQEGLKSMKPNELRTLMANQQKAVDMLFDKHSGQILFGEVIDAGEDKASQIAARKVLSDRLDEVIMKYGTENFGKQFPMSVAIQMNFAPIPSKLAKPRHLIAATAAYYATKLESMSAKHYPVGTNAIGLKTPNKQTVPYGNVTHSISKEDFLNNYGKDALHVGLLPVVYRYYLSLVRDKVANWWDQPPERFFLVSPCYADVSLKVTNCECSGHEDEDAGLYWTGKEYELEDGRIINVPHFDGKNPMIYRLDENGNPIKECYASSFFRFDKESSIKCIKINPVLDEDKDPNYCYHGKNSKYTAFKVGVTTLEMGLPLLGMFCGPAAPACMAGIGFVSGMGFETLKGGMDIGHQWPEHS